MWDGAGDDTGVLRRGDRSTGCGDGVWSPSSSIAKLEVAARMELWADGMYVPFGRSNCVTVCERKVSTSDAGCQRRIAQLLLLSIYTLGSIGSGMKRDQPRKFRSSDSFFFADIRVGVSGGCQYPPRSWLAGWLKSRERNLRPSEDALSSGSKVSDSGPTHHTAGRD